MIIKNILLSFLIIILSAYNSTYSQEDINCDGARYRYLIFDDFEKIEDVVYGSNIAANGSVVELEMDIYLPSEDTVTNRPAVIVAHGGFFLMGGNEFDDVVPLCEDLAKMGYIAVSISYRLGIDNWLNLQESMQEAVLRGVHDGKAAIRFLRKVHAEENNPWGIDPDRIIMGGSSAGAFIALHNAYLDLEEFPDIIDITQPGLGGGLEGESGNLGYSSDLLSIFSLSGAIGNAEWMLDDTIPVVSTHGTDDDTVPIGSGSIQFMFISVDDADGSEVVHDVANALELENCFHVFEGAGHVPHQFSDNYYDTTRAVITGFNSRMVCPIYEPICGYYDVTAPPEIDEPPTICPQDIEPNGIVDVNDMLVFIANYGCIGACIGDFNETGSVTISDLLSILAIFGSYCE